MEEFCAKFNVGQLVHHVLFDYRGVIVDVDPDFQGAEEWYDQVAKSRPPKNRPWYHVLVHDAGYETYVAERNLEPDQSGDPIVHPLVEHFFAELRDGCYIPKQRAN